jgi:hypothetical protein
MKIDAPSDATRYTLFALPHGATLTKTVRGYALYDVYGTPLGVLPLPEAVDAKQKPVPINYKITDSALTLTVSHAAAIHPVSIILRGPTCRNWSCGWAFTKAQTQALFGAVVAGGTVAGLAACARLAGPTPVGVGCAVIVTVVAYLLAQSIPYLNRCLYISLSPPGRDQLYSC